jgi:hypothetical protein
MRKTTLPQIPPGGGALGRAVKQVLDTWAGHRDPLDAVLTYRDLGETDLAEVRQEAGRPVVRAPGQAGPPATVLTDLEAAGAFEHVVVSWAGTHQRNYGHTEIWRSTENNLGAASLIGTAIAPVFADPVGGGWSGFYWVRAVNGDGQPGPFNATAGTPGETATDPAILLDKLTGKITESQLYEDLSSRVDLIDGPKALPGSVNARVAAEAALRDDAIGTAITNERGQRVDGDTALADTISLIGAKSGDGLAFIFDSDTVKVTPDVSLTERFSQLQSSIGDNAGSITHEENTRADADSAMAETINQVSSTVGDNTSTISEHAKTLDGLKAEYTVQLDVNGYASGFGTYNDGKTSKFIVLADQFAVVKPGEAGQTPFVVGEVNGQSTVGIRGQLVIDGSLDVARATFGKLTADRLDVNELASVAQTTGALSIGALTTGELGSNGQPKESGTRVELRRNDAFPLWYGHGARNKANAYFAVTNDGDVKIAGNAQFSGEVTASNIRGGSTLEPGSGYIHTANNCFCPWVAGTRGSFVDFNPSSAGRTLQLETFVGPNQGSGFEMRRVLDYNMDFYIHFYVDAEDSGTTCYVQRQYDSEGWHTITQLGLGATAESVGARDFIYTTKASHWGKLRFRFKTNNVTAYLSASVAVYNTSASVRSTGMHNDGTHGSGGGGGDSGGGGGTTTPPPSCVTADTLVALPDGTTARADALVMGQHVASLDLVALDPSREDAYETWRETSLDGSTATATTVASVAPATVRFVFRIAAGAHTVNVTPEHPFVVFDGEAFVFKQACELTPEDSLVEPDCTVVPIDSIERLKGRFRIVKLDCEPYDLFVHAGLLGHNHKKGGGGF